MGIAYGLYNYDTSGLYNVRSVTDGRVGVFQAM